MNKIIILLALVATLIAVSAFPHVDVPVELEETALDDDYQRIPSEFGVAEQEDNHRVKRATCDLLSGFGWNHGPCAAHCMLRGNKGGYCSGKGVCICRN